MDISDHHSTLHVEMMAGYYRKPQEIRYCGTHWYRRRPSKLHKTTCCKQAYGHSIIYDDNTLPLYL